MQMIAEADPSDLRQALDVYFKNISDSPLRAVVASKDMEKRLASFDEADATALAEQRSYRRAGRFALWTMLLSAVIGAVALLPVRVESLHRAVLEAIQGLAMVLTFVAVIWIGWHKPVGEWMRARAKAEGIRSDVFRAIIQTAHDTAAQLAPALDCFSLAHLRWQLGFYKKRGPEHRRAAGHITPYRITGYLLLVTALLLGLAGLVNSAEALGWSWPPLTAAIKLIPLERPGTWQLGIGAIASNVLAFASARSFMDQDDRNASCYALAAQQLEALERDELPKAQAAAVAGRFQDVVTFCEKVQSVLSAEHSAWAFSRPASDLPSARPPI
jgi:hypothetical protein